MIHSSIHTVHYPDGSFQRFQRVQTDRWEELFFTQPVSIPGAYHQVLQLYLEYLIPRYRPFLKTCVLFRIPDSMKQNEPVEYRNTVYFQTEAYMAARLRDAVHYRRSFLSVDNPEAQQLHAQLNDSGCLGIASGKLPGVSILPVGDTFGFLSETSASLAVNASFFIMNPSDVTSPFDSIGTSFGLAVQNGTVLYPPLFEREALLVHQSGKVELRNVSLSETSVEIDGTVYQDGRNCTFFSRPKFIRTPKGGYDLVISGNRLAALSQGGNTPVPSSGFVIHLDTCPTPGKNPVFHFHGFETILFGIQGGCSAVISGKKATRFHSSFHDFRKPWTHSFPPTFYPLNFQKDRAPRILIGSDSQDQPVLLWLEGAGKYGYVPGQESCGASLAVAADLAASAGMVNALHLDGGGSAQIRINGTRSLKVSDRDPVTLEEQERAVSLAICAN